MYARRSEMLVWNHGLKSLSGSAGVISDQHDFIAIGEKNLKIFNISKMEIIREIKHIKRISRLLLSQDQELMYYIADKKIGVLNTLTWQQLSSTKIIFPSQYVSCEIKSMHYYRDFKDQVLLHISCQECNLFAICFVKTGEIEVLTEELEKNGITEITFDYYAENEELYILRETMKTEKKEVPTKKMKVGSMAFDIRVQRIQIDISVFDLQSGVTPLLVTPGNGIIAYYTTDFFKSKLTFLDHINNKMIYDISIFKPGLLMQKKYDAETHRLILVFNDIVLVFLVQDESIELEKKIKTKYAVDCLLLDHGNRLLIVQWFSGLIVDL